MKGHILLTNMLFLVGVFSIYDPDVYRPRVICEPNPFPLGHPGVYGGLSEDMYYRGRYLGGGLGAISASARAKMAASATAHALANGASPASARMYGSRYALGYYDAYNMRDLHDVAAANPNAHAFLYGRDLHAEGHSIGKSHGLSYAEAQNYGMGYRDGAIRGCKGCAVHPLADHVW